MTEKFLNGANVMAVFEQVRREGMTQRVAGGALGDSGGESGIVNGSLNHRLVKVVSAVSAGLGVEVSSSRRKDPLPCRRPRRRRILAIERIGHFDPTRAGQEIGFVSIHAALNLGL